MRGSVVRGIVTGVVVAGLALGLLGGLLLGRDRGPTEEDRAGAALAEFTQAWAAGDPDRAGVVTNSPDEAAKVLEETTERLAVTAVAIDRGQVTLSGDKRSGRATFAVALTLRGLGEWRYESAADLVKIGERWLVRWAPASVHPALTATTRLGRERELPPRAPILDRDGDPLMTERPVVTIGIWPAKLTDPDAAYQVIGETLDVDVDRLRDRVGKADPDAFVEVITLREAAYRDVRAQLRDVPGLVFDEGVRTLAPTREFARALLGTVAPATEETLRQAGPLASPADLVGGSGLQLQFEKRLAGSPGGRVLLLDRESDRRIKELHVFSPVPGEPVTVTIDRDMQEAAERALAGISEPAALVAIRPSTGAVLAVANRPGDNAYDRALVGQYPPGSTFKVVTTAALLTDGLRPTDQVTCPRRIEVSGKSFENQDEFALGTVPFRVDFARSCNTAFVSLADRVAGSPLVRAGDGFGLGATWQVGVASYTGSVPDTTDPVDSAAAVIGQGDVLVSPLAMASVAATVSAGQFHQPALLIDPAPASAFRPAVQLDGGALADLRALMRAVVTEGSGSALRDLPGNPAAKTGTAEFEQDGEIGMHAWMIGFRGDVAFAVLIEGGGSGGRDAGPIAARFLEAR
ncbi:MAG TPA: penicillin-binding transpeptidase domain-containing protein [Actinomycetes bacterium]|nr:penicillin-binding transpeptidase domain-containing protein [Actinomycetes bacterium]